MQAAGAAWDWMLALPRSQSRAFRAGVTAQTLTTLYTFSILPDGASPFDTPIAVAGNLYGTTFSGGSAVCTGGCGTVFKLTPSRNDRRWRETVLYRFTGSDGANPAAGLNPVAGLIADASGNLYGTTELGGGASGCSGGCGTVFKVTPSGAETVLHSFTGGSDGASPVGGLIADAAGNLTAPLNWAAAPSVVPAVAARCSK